MTGSPLQHYLRLVDGGAVTSDPHQVQAVTALDDLWHALSKSSRPGLLGRVTRRGSPPLRGLYLWGGVGRGKTWLMDLFYECLPVAGKQRIHFHRFMQRVHNALAERPDTRNPLSKVAASWAESCRVLCLDEFFVSDIADAMLLGGLLDHLFRRGVTLVTTSNTAPDDLYRDGLQRAKFLPAIELIKQHSRVMELAGGTDFRLRILEQSEIFHHPLDEAADAVLTASFERMAAECEMNHALDINGRTFHARRRGDGIIWFDFRELCEKPRGAVDYIEIARAFNTVVISNTPRMGENDANAARRFITLVDEFYDRNVKLLMSAEAPVDALYTGRKLSFEFERTASRLTEMQSHEYLARPHLP
ncbi:MAG: AFG1 family ATPase [Gammaproteobacteria bacterium]|nr:AFG1 family ATPase [Gammaproteobacteria bacterium]